MLDLFEKWPPPLGSISDICELEKKLMVNDPSPRTDILKGLFRYIYIEKGQIKCFSFSFYDGV